jgi:hypothetical protein
MRFASGFRKNLEGVSKWIAKSGIFLRRADGLNISGSESTEAVEIVHPSILIFRR